MKKEQLKDGMVLVVTRDVKNPQPDRRKVRDLGAQVTWEKGDRLFVDSFDYVTLNSGEVYGRVYERHPGFEALLDACEEAPRTLDNILFSASKGGRLMGYPGAILRELVELGKVSLDDVEGALAITNARDALEE